MLEGIVIGAGMRGGDAYVPRLLERPELGRIVGVAEPDPTRRRSFAERHGIEERHCHPDHHRLFAEPPRADFAVVATGDALHVEPTLMALERGLHVLLEKPMATREADCVRLVEAAERADRILQICHVLRYAPFFASLGEALQGGRIGEIVSIQHAENVSYWHYAHSYCRGNWRNTEASSPLILAKSCHDLDLLQWFAGAPPTHIASASQPTRLHPRNRPDGAPERCIDGCPHSERCPYDAVALYADAKPLIEDVAQTRNMGPRMAAVGWAAVARGWAVRAELPVLRDRWRWRGWPVAAITPDRSRSGVERALRDTLYGRCVYTIEDHDQVASQWVGIRFANGVIASFSLHGHSHREGRTLRIDGTKGTVIGRFHLLEQWLEWHDHGSGRSERERFFGGAAGHGGGDTKLFEGFLAAVRGEANAETSARESLMSHRMAFAADRAAREGRTIRVEP